MRSGSPVNTPAPSWEIVDVLPCMTRGARTTSPPYSCPMHWCPRHTPSTGTPRSPKARMASFDTPASSARAGGDEHGVGDEGLELGQRHLVVSVHDGLGAQLPQVLHEVVDERVVVVDHQHAGRGHDL